MVKAAKLTVQHYRGIGQVLAEWAKIEYLMVRALETLLEVEVSKAAAIFWHMSFKERKARMANLICLIQEDENDPFRKEFDVLSKRLEAAETIRNMVAHSVWSRGNRKGDIIPLIIQAKGGPLKVSGHNLKEHVFNAPRLKAEADMLNRLNKDFRHFFSKHYPRLFYEGQIVWLSTPSH